MFSTLYSNCTLARSRHASAPLRMLPCIAALMTASLIPFTHARAEADALFSCEGDAYITQGHLSRTYELDTESGDYQVATEYHSNQTPPSDSSSDRASLDALGYNPNDGFIYAWSNFHEQVVRVHADWSVEPLVALNTDNARFYIGDVSPIENRYYLYSDHSTVGLIYIELDPAHPNYLQTQEVATDKKLSLNIADMAVHPTSGLIYAVERNGDVIEINPQTGVINVLGNADVRGSFGAAFFDSKGNLLVGRNYDGKIFSIGIDSGNYVAEFVANGPASSSNDGFSCAGGQDNTDPVDNTGPLADFGDAPTSYGTALNADGARHLFTSANGLRLGAAIDGETDAYAFPLSDNTEGVDEDGVAFVTNLVEGRTARAMVNASGDAYFNLWVDVDRNGAFDATDQLVIDKIVKAGDNRIAIPIPDTVVAGETWARARLSSAPGVQATGSAQDGEVEDYTVTLLADSLVVTSYPSAATYSTIAFEDNWPFVGDYDMNDLVVRMRTRTYRDAQGYTQVDMEGFITAAGAFYKNGFGIRLQGVPRDAVDEANIEFAVSAIDSLTSPLEAGRNEAIFIITDNVFNHVAPGQDCEYYRSEPECGGDLEFSFSLSIPFKSPQAVDLSGVFDPFLFATPGAYHGAHFVAPPGRAFEIHLKNQAPTEAFDQSLFAGVGQDASNPAAGYYFQTETGMPWALEVGTDWRYPYEYTDISTAYPTFSEFATSDGSISTDWYLDTNADQEYIVPE